MRKRLWVRVRVQRWVREREDETVRKRLWVRVRVQRWMRERMRKRRGVREMSSAVSLRDDFIDICPLIYFRMKDANVTSDQLEDRRSQHVTFDLISSVDGPLSSQIRFGCVS